MSKNRNYYRVSEVAKLLNVSPATIRYYANNDLIEFTRTPQNQRVFTQEQVDKFLGVSKTEKLGYYTRSSQGKQDQLESQKNALTQAYGYPVKYYTDKGSGLSEKRRGLNSLLNDAEKGLINVVCITQKDRLTRFGYLYLERLLKSYGAEIRVLGETEHKTIYDELLQDFMSLIASFSGKFYRLRGYEQQKKLLELAETTINEKQ